MALFGRLFLREENEAVSKLEQTFNEQRRAIAEEIKARGETMLYVIGDTFREAGPEGRTFLREPTVASAKASPEAVTWLVEELAAKGLPGFPLFKDHINRYDLVGIWELVAALFSLVSPFTGGKAEGSTSFYSAKDRLSPQTTFPSVTQAPRSVKTPDDLAGITYEQGFGSAATFDEVVQLGSSPRAKRTLQFGPAETDPQPRLDRFYSAKSTLSKNSSFNIPVGSQDLSGFKDLVVRSAALLGGSSSPDFETVQPSSLHGGHSGLLRGDLNYPESPPPRHSGPLKGGLETLPPSPLGHLEDYTFVGKWKHVEGGSPSVRSSSLGGRSSSREVMMWMGEAGMLDDEDEMIICDETASATRKEAPKESQRGAFDWWMFGSTQPQESITQALPKDSPPSTGQLRDFTSAASELEEIPSWTQQSPPRDLAPVWRKRDYTEEAFPGDKALTQRPEDEAVAALHAPPSRRRLSFEAGGRQFDSIQEDRWLPKNRRPMAKTKTLGGSRVFDAAQPSTYEALHGMTGGDASETTDEETSDDDTSDEELLDEVSRSDEAAVRKASRFAADQEQAAPGAVRAMVPGRKLGPVNLAFFTSQGVRPPEQKEREKAADSARGDPLGSLEEANSVEESRPTTGPPLGSASGKADDYGGRAFVLSTSLAEMEAVGTPSLSAASEASGREDRDRTGFGTEQVQSISALETSHELLSQASVASISSEEEERQELENSRRMYLEVLKELKNDSFFLNQWVGAASDDFPEADDGVVCEPLIQEGSVSHASGEAHSTAASFASAGLPPTEGTPGAVNPRPVLRESSQSQVVSRPSSLESASRGAIHFEAAETPEVGRPAGEGALKPSTDAMPVHTAFQAGDLLAENVSLESTVVSTLEERRRDGQKLASLADNSTAERRMETGNEGSREPTEEAHSGVHQGLLSTESAGTVRLPKDANLAPGTSRTGTRRSDRRSKAESEGGLVTRDGTVLALADVARAPASSSDYDRNSRGAEAQVEDSGRSRKSGATFWKKVLTWKGNRAGAEDEGASEGKEQRQELVTSDPSQSQAAKKEVSWSGLVKDEEEPLGWSDTSEVSGQGAQLKLLESDADSRERGVNAGRREDVLESGPAGGEGAGDQAVENATRPESLPVALERGAGGMRREWTGGAQMLQVEADRTLEQREGCPKPGFAQSFEEAEPGSLSVGPSEGDGIESKAEPSDGRGLGRVKKEVAACAAILKAEAEWVILGKEAPTESLNAEVQAYKPLARSSLGGGVQTAAQESPVKEDGNLKVETLRDESTAAPSGLEKVVLETGLEAQTNLPALSTAAVRPVGTQKDDAIGASTAPEDDAAFPAQQEVWGQLEDNDEVILEETEPARSKHQLLRESASVLLHTQGGEASRQNSGGGAGKAPASKGEAPHAGSMGTDTFVGRLDSPTASEDSILDMRRPLPVLELSPSPEIPTRRSPANSDVLRRVNISGGGLFTMENSRRRVPGLEDPSLFGDTVSTPTPASTPTSTLAEQSGLPPGAATTMTKGSPPGGSLIGGMAPPVGMQVELPTFDAGFAKLRINLEAYQPPPIVKPPAETPFSNSPEAILRTPEKGPDEDDTASSRQRALKANQEAAGQREGVQQKAAAVATATLTEAELELPQQKMARASPSTSDSMLPAEVSSQASAEPQMETPSNSERPRPPELTPSNPSSVSEPLLPGSPIQPLSKHASRALSAEVAYFADTGRSPSAATLGPLNGDIRGGLGKEAVNDARPIEAMAYGRTIEAVEIGSRNEAVEVGRPLKAVEIGRPVEAVEVETVNKDKDIGRPIEAVEAGRSIETVGVRAVNDTLEGEHPTAAADERASSETLEEPESPTRAALGNLIKVAEGHLAEARKRLAAASGNCRETESPPLRRDSEGRKTREGGATRAADVSVAGASTSGSWRAAPGEEPREASPTLLRSLEALAAAESASVLAAAIAVGHQMVESKPSGVERRDAKATKVTSQRPPRPRAPTNSAGLETAVVLLEALLSEQEPRFAFAGGASLSPKSSRLAIESKSNSAMEGKLLATAWLAAHTPDEQAQQDISVGRAKGLSSGIPRKVIDEAPVIERSVSQAEESTTVVETEGKQTAGSGKGQPEAAPGQLLEAEFEEAKRAIAKIEAAVVAAGSNEGAAGKRDLVQEEDSEQGADLESVLVQQRSEAERETDAGEVKRLAAIVVSLEGATVAKKRIPPKEVNAAEEALPTKENAPRAYKPYSLSQGFGRFLRRHGLAFRSEELFTKPWEQASSAEREVQAQKSWAALITAEESGATEERSKLEAISDTSESKSDDGKEKEQAPSPVVIPILSVSTNSIAIKSEQMEDASANDVEELSAQQREKEGPVRTGKRRGAESRPLSPEGLKEETQKALWGALEGVGVTSLREGKGQKGVQQKQIAGRGERPELDGLYPREKRTLVRAVLDRNHRRNRRREGQRGKKVQDASAALARAIVDSFLELEPPREQPMPPEGKKDETSRFVQEIASKVYLRFAEQKTIAAKKRRFAAKQQAGKLSAGPRAASETGGGPAVSAAASGQLSEAPVAGPLPGKPLTATLEPDNPGFVQGAEPRANESPTIRYTEKRIDSSLPEEALLPAPRTSEPFEASLQPQVPRGPSASSPSEVVPQSGRRRTVNRTMRDSEQSASHPRPTANAIPLPNITLTPPPTTAQTAAPDRAFPGRTRASRSQHKESSTRQRRSPPKDRGSEGRNARTSKDWAASRERSQRGSGSASPVRGFVKTPGGLVRTPRLKIVSPARTPGPLSPQLPLSPSTIGRHRRLTTVPHPSPKPRAAQIAPMDLIGAKDDAAVESIFSSWEEEERSFATSQIHAMPEQEGQLEPAAIAGAPTIGRGPRGSSLLVGRVLTASVGQNENVTEDKCVLPEQSQSTENAERGVDPRNLSRGEFPWKKELEAGSFLGLWRNQAAMWREAALSSRSPKGGPKQSLETGDGAIESVPASPMQGPKDNLWEDLRESPRPVAVGKPARAASLSPWPAPAPRKLRFITDLFRPKKKRDAARKTVSAPAESAAPSVEAPLNVEESREGAAKVADTTIEESAASSAQRQERRTRTPPPMISVTNLSLTQTLDTSSTQEAPGVTLWELESHEAVVERPDSSVAALLERHDVVEEPPSSPKESADVSVPASLSPRAKSARKPPLSPASRLNVAKPARPPSNWQPSPSRFGRSRSLDSMTSAPEAPLLERVPSAERAEGKEAAQAEVSKAKEQDPADQTVPVTSSLESKLPPNVAGHEAAPLPPLSPPELGSDFGTAVNISKGTAVNEAAAEDSLAPVDTDRFEQLAAANGISGGQGGVEPSGGAIVPAEGPPQSVQGTASLPAEKLDLSGKSDAAYSPQRAPQERASRAVAEDGEQHRSERSTGEVSIRKTEKDNLQFEREQIAAEGRGASESVSGGLVAKQKEGDSFEKTPSGNGADGASNERDAAAIEAQEEDRSMTGGDNETENSPVQGAPEAAKTPPPKKRSGCLPNVFSGKSKGKQPPAPGNIGNQRSSSVVEVPVQPTGNATPPLGADATVASETTEPRSDEMDTVKDLPFGDEGTRKPEVLADRSFQTPKRLPQLVRARPAVAKTQGEEPKAQSSEESLLPLAAVSEQFGKEESSASKGATTSTGQTDATKALQSTVKSSGESSTGRPRVTSSLSLPPFRASINEAEEGQAEEIFRRGAALLDALEADADVQVFRGPNSRRTIRAAQMERGLEEPLDLEVVISPNRRGARAEFPLKYSPSMKGLRPKSSPGASPSLRPSPCPPARSPAWRDVSTHFEVLRKEASELTRKQREMLIKSRVRHLREESDVVVTSPERQDGQGREGHKESPNLAAEKGEAFGDQVAGGGAQVVATEEETTAEEQPELLDVLARRAALHEPAALSSSPSKLDRRQKRAKLSLYLATYESSGMVPEKVEKRSTAIPFLYEQAVAAANQPV